MVSPSPFPPFFARSRFYCSIFSLIYKDRDPDTGFCILDTLGTKLLPHHYYHHLCQESDNIAFLPPPAAKIEVKSAKYFSNKIMKSYSLKQVHYHTCMYRVSAREKSASSRCANRLHVIVIQYNSFRSKLIHVWGFYFGAMEPNIAPTIIIYNHQQDM